MPDAVPPADDPTRRPVTVHVTAGERARIEARANRAGLSVSAYLRDAGLGRAIRARGASDARVSLSALDGALTELVDALGEAGPDRVAAALSHIKSARDLMIEAAGRL